MYQPKMISELDGLELGPGLPTGRIKIGVTNPETSQRTPYYLAGFYNNKAL